MNHAFAEGTTLKINDTVTVPGSLVGHPGHVMLAIVTDGPEPVGGTEEWLVTTGGQQFWVPADALKIHN